MSKKRVYLKAYYRKNLGDDMFVQTILRRYPDIEFCACARGEDLPNLTEDNLRPVPPWQLFWDRVVYRMRGKKKATNHYEKRADATVHIGGSIFIEPKNFKRPHGFYYPKNMYYIGCNFGPFQTEDYYGFIRGRLARATDVCFRDSASLAAFSDLKTVRCAPDVLFGYPDYPKQQKGNGIGISVIDMTNRPDLQHVAQAYETVLAEVIDLCKARGICVTLFSFCWAEGDENAIDRILERSSTKAANRCEYQGDIAGFLEHFNECEYILATRFHAMVIGWALGKKVLPVIYSHKQTNVIADVGFTGSYWDVKAEEVPAAQTLLQMCTDAPALKNRAKYARDSQEQFAAFDRFSLI